jgi:D-sedoheptulose 7-phosphate isomerase
VTDFSRVFREVAANMAALADSPYIDALERAADTLFEAFQNGGTLLVFGNGGSAADAQHLTAELVGRFRAERRALPAVALTGNEALLTAWSNDRSFEDVFARQIEALGRRGDVALGISTSGASRNVVAAMARARELGLRTIGMTGAGGGRLGEWCDVLMAAPFTDTARVQEVHLVTYHAICAALDARLTQAP